MKNVYLVSFETPEPVSVDDRLGLKRWLGEMVRDALSLNLVDTPVAVDHLEPTEPHVAPLLGCDPD